MAQPQTTTELGEAWIVHSSKDTTTHLGANTNGGTKTDLDDVIGNTEETLPITDSATAIRAAGS